MKYQLLCLLIVMGFISAGTVPTSGVFVISAYNSTACTYKVRDSGLYYGANSCWDTALSTSMKPSSWNSTTGILTTSYYTGSSTCSNTPITIPLYCSGACIQSGNSGEYYTCIYVDIPMTSTFTFTGYSDDKCALPTTEKGTYKGETNLCWPTSPTTSIVPLSFNLSNKTLLGFCWSATSSCLGSTNVDYGSIVCDGSCNKNGLPTSNYYACSTYSSGSYFTLSLLGLLALLILLLE